MMESMIENPTPTRAEASDCATAIYDSSDAVMLSAESAAGKYPVESVLMQQQIINRVETDEVFRAGLDRFAKEFDVLQSKDSTTLAITLAARQVIHIHHHLSTHHHHLSTHHHHLSTHHHHHLSIPIRLPIGC
jgi:pyruvate kinase